MKLLITWFLLLPCAVLLFRTTRFDHLDFTGDQFDISWDDVTDDLWP